MKRQRKTESEDRNITLDARPIFQNGSKRITRVGVACAVSTLTSEE